MSAPREILLLFGGPWNTSQRKKNSIGTAKRLLTLFFHIYPTGMFS